MVFEIEQKNSSRNIINNNNDAKTKVEIQTKNKMTQQLSFKMRSNQNTVEHHPWGLCE